MITTARWTLRILNWLNWSVGIIVVLVGLLVGYVVPDQFMAAAAQSDVAHPENLLPFFRIALPATVPVIWLAHLIFTRLIAMIDSIPMGQVFTALNADRLRTVAWALLGTQVIDLIVGVYMQKISTDSGEYLGWSLGLSGWVAALMLLILARVFREGAAMREELEGTV